MSFNSEPAVWIAAIQAIIAVAIGFGLDISSDQMALITVALTAVAALLIRSRVTPWNPPPPPPPGG